jgi:hypothetical protein
MNELMVLLQGQGGNTDEDINFFGHVAKTRAGSNMRVAMGDFMVWAQKLDLSIHQNTIGKQTSRAIN